MTATPKDVLNIDAMCEPAELMAAAYIERLSHIRRWAVISGGEQIVSYATRQGAQRHANRLNGEITR